MHTSSPQANFDNTGLTLPEPPKPLGVYKPFLVVGNMVYVSGHGPFQNDGTLITGTVGKELDQEQGKMAAQQVGLTIIATLTHNLGSLDKIKRVIKVLGMVNCTKEFEKHPYIINGCSELFRTIWGEDLGVGVRSAVGMGSLPDNIPVEIEAMFELA